MSCSGRTRISTPNGAPFAAEALTRLTRHLLDELVDSGVGAVIDGNFNLVAHAVDVRDVVGRADVVACEVQVGGNLAVLRERFIKRADPPLTRTLAPYHESILSTPPWTVLDDSARVLHLDSTDLVAFAAQLDAAVEWVEAVTQLTAR